MAISTKFEKLPPRQQKEVEELVDSFLAEENETSEKLSQEWAV
jgi:TRAP-type C4-dicarboxylate transport system substrate-binding protein